MANASPAKSLQKATWRKTLFWAQKKNGGEQSNDGLGPISSCSCFIFGFSLNVRQDAGQREWMSERPRVGILELKNKNICGRRLLLSTVRSANSDGAAATAKVFFFIRQLCSFERLSRRLAHKKLMSRDSCRPNYF